MPGATILLPAAPSLRVFEFSYNGVTIGGTRSDIGLDTLDGLGMPPVRKSSVPRLTDHGALVAAQYLDERILVAAGTITNADQALLERRKISLGAALVPRAPRDDLPITVVMADRVVRVVYAVPSRGPVWTIDSIGAKILVRWAVEWTAADPRIYAGDATILSVLPQSPVLPGFDFPFDFPFDFGGGNPGYGILANAGTIDTLPFVRIYGPATDPTLIKVATGEQVSLAITLGSTDHLDVDFAARTITLNDTASRYGNLDIGSVWWTVDPGDNLIQFLASGTDAPTQAQFTFRSAWGAV